MKDEWQELDQLIQLRDQMNKRIIHLRAKLRLETPLKGHLTVRCRDLAPYIQEALDLGMTINVLASKAMVSPKTIRNIMKYEYKLVYDVTADRILTALGIPHVLPSIRLNEPIEVEE